MRPVQRRYPLKLQGSLQRNLPLEKIQLAKDEFEERPPTITGGTYVMR